MRKFLLVLLLLLCYLPQLFAEPANPTPIKFTQPDGSVVTIIQKGDERISWAITTDGYKLLNNGKNGWEYAVTDASGNLKASGILAHEPYKRNISERLLLKSISKTIFFSPKQVQSIKAANETGLPATNTKGVLKVSGINISSGLTTSKGAQKIFSPTGPKKLLLILVQFSDRDLKYTTSDFNGLMNTVGYSANGAQGSVHDYFLENSYGKFNLTTDVIGPYKVSNTHDYYGADDGTTKDMHYKEMFLDAIAQADAAGVDFSQYDSDGDGVVDGVYLIFPGWSQAHSGIANDIWSKAGTIDYTVTNAASKGVKVASVSCSNELLYESADHQGMATIGVICHEFGHVCNAPDYYDTDYDTGGQYDGTGKWDVMCNGNNNGTTAILSGNSPAHFNPYTKMMFGWLTPIVVTNATSLSIPDITANPVVYRYNTNTQNEYFLIENRQLTGFNKALPGHGLMIYHKDNRPYMRGDVGNNNTYPQSLYPVCASATTSPTTTSDPASYGNINSTGCPFPGNSGKQVFDDTTNPTSNSWAGVATNMPISGITEDATSKTITLCIKGCPTVNAVLNLKSLVASGSQIDLSWTNNAAGNYVIIATNSSKTFGTPITGTAYNVKDVLPGGGTIIYKGSASAFSHTSLSASTSYYYQVWAVDGSNNYSEGNPTSSTTLVGSVTTFPFIEGFNSTTIPTNWSQIYGTGTVDWQYVTAGTRNNSKPAASHTGADFAYCGSNIIATYTTKLISPPLDLSGTTSPVLKFWYNQYPHTTYGPDVLRIYYRTSAMADWTLITTFNDTPSRWTLKTLTLPNPSANYYIAFEGTTNTGYGVCIDDMTILKTPCSTNIWNGMTSTDWFTASNWSCGIVPDLETDVEIPSGTTYSPTIAEAGAVCHNITIDAGATLAMDASTAYTFTVYGNLTNNNVFTPGAGTVSFQGTNALQTISGSATTNFNILEVKTGAIGNVLEVTSLINFLTTIPSTTNPLVLTSGTFKLSSASSLIVANSAQFIIPGISGFWNNGGTISSGSVNWSLSGSLKSSSGSNTIGGSLKYETGSSVIIEGGSVSIGYGFNPSTDGVSAITFLQSGGTITTPTIYSTPIPFNLTSNSSFIMSGGTIIVQRNSTNTSDYQNLASTNTVTGGTLQIGNGLTSLNKIIRINSTVPIYNLTINSYHAPTAQLGTNPLTVYGDITIGTGATLDANSLNLSLAGNWTNGGTFTPGTGTVTCNGAANQTLISGGSGAGKTFYNLAVNNPAGVTLSTNDLSVSNLLTFTSGVITTGSNKLIIPASGSITRSSSGHVNGNLQKNIATGTAVSRTFEIGDATNYTPATVSFTNVTTTGNLTAKATAGDHPSIGTSTLNADKSINRYWTLTNNGIVFDNYNGSFAFISDDNNESANTSSLIAGKYSGSTWEYPTFTSSASPLSINGLTSFGDFAFAEKKATTGIPDVSSDNSVLVYRNALNQIVVSIENNDPNEALISVYNSIGQIIAKKKSIQPVTTIDKHLLPGMYMVTIQKSDKVLLKKLIIN